GAAVAHELEGRLAGGGGVVGEAGDALEQLRVVLVDADRGARSLLALEVLAHAERAVGVDPPRQVDPELVLLPDLALVELVRATVGIELPALELGVAAHHRLAETDPAPGVGLEARQVVAL